MDLNLCKEESQVKLTLSVRVYSTVIEELERISQKENVKSAVFVRHALNNAIDQYKEQELKSTNKTQG